MIEFDPASGTTHDHKPVRVLASVLMQEHLEEAIQKNIQKDAIMQIELKFRDFDWKQIKCALIELSYSWHATEAFDKKNLKSIVKYIEQSFNISPLEIFTIPMTGFADVRTPRCISMK